MNSLNLLEKKYIGKRCFIIGGGDSLNNLNLPIPLQEALKNEITIGVTKAYKLLTPTYLYWSDPHFWSSYKSEITKVNCVKICPTISVDASTAAQYGISVFHRGPKTNPVLQDSFEDLNIRNNSGVAALRIAYIMGFNPIYLLGFDMNNDDVENGKSHFHMDYKKDNLKRYLKTNTPEHYDGFYEEFKKTIEAISKRGVSVVSCSPTSRLNEIIEYRDIPAVLENVTAEVLNMRRNPKKSTKPVKIYINPENNKATIKKKKKKPKRPPSVINTTGKQKVLFSVSPSGWAYHNRCLALEKRLNKYYDILIESNPFAAKYGHRFDLVYVSGFEAFGKKNFVNNGTRYVTTIGGLVVKTLQQAIELTQRSRALAIPNMRWYEDFVRLSNKPVFYIPNGVDTKLFTPNEDTRKGNFRIGWVGNDKPHRLPVKRINILREVCYKLNIELVEHNWNHNNIPHDKMPGYYKKIDLYINTSVTEGSNNPILEACASGIPVLATPVGNAPELVESGLELLSPDLSDLGQKIMAFKKMDKHKRKEIGLNLRNRMVEEFDWDLIAERYREMFETVLKG